MIRGFLYGVLAAAGAIGLSLVFRFALGAPTPGEVLMDWATTLVPLEAMSSLLRLLGGGTKVLAFVLLTLGSIIVAGVVAGLWLKAERHVAELLPSGMLARSALARDLLLGALLWLVAMLAVLPVAGGGLFGAATPSGLPSVAISWLVLALAYGFFLYLLREKAFAQAAKAEGGVEVDVGRRRLVKRVAVGLGIAVVLVGIGGGVWAAISRFGRRTVVFVREWSVPSYITSVGFYTVSKNLFDPRVDAGTWRLEVGGEVEEPFSLSYEEVRALPSREEIVTLECISNEVGGPYIGNARWRGVPLRDLLDSAGVKSTARKVVLHAADDYSDSIPLDKALAEGVLLAYQMNDEVLPKAHGYPLRLLVPGIYGMKNVKWITRIEVVDYDYRGYWQVRGWSDEAVIKTMSRIDVPPDPAPHRTEDIFMGGPPPSEVQVPLGNLSFLAGVAFSGDRGISRVQVSTDGGNTWMEGEIREVLSPYTWVVWTRDWEPPATGEYVLQVRAADGTGEFQSPEPVPTLPDGAEGYHTFVLRVIPPVG